MCPPNSRQERKDGSARVGTWVIGQTRIKLYVSPYNFNPCLTNFHTRVVLFFLSVFLAGKIITVAGVVGAVFVSRNIIGVSRSYDKPEHMNVYSASTTSTAPTKMCSLWPTHSFVSSKRYSANISCFSIDL